MIHSTITDSEFQYVVVGSLVCDQLTGEVEASPWGVRDLIDWRRSLALGTGLHQLLIMFAYLYPDDPADVLPGFAFEEMGKQERGTNPRAREEHGAASRSLGLSTSNKVVIRNKATGEEFEVDKVQARLSRMRRRVFAWADAIKPANEAYDKIMITLTYAGVDDWRAGHIRDFMLGVKKELRRRLVAYAWCAELQKRGAVHYHVILIVRKGARLEMPDKTGLWPHGMTKIEKARTVFYIASYMKKEYQKMGEFPKGLRMFAVWFADGVVADLERWLFRLSSLPKWLYDEIMALGAAVHLETWMRPPGGGWWFAGKRWRSPFAFAGFA